jgi:dTDP-4-dehydrorhamnose 3,5-epimerase
MIFTPAGLDGAYTVEMERRADARGWFARAWCAEELAALGLAAAVAQANVARTARRGTVRGLHWQAAPHGEAKLVRCTRGAVFDVAVDLRPASPTHGRWIGVELGEEDGRMLYVPEGCAHGYQALADDAEVTYLVSAPHVPSAERGVRWDDPAFGIRWPLEADSVSARDLSWPDYRPSSVPVPIVR